MRENGKLTLSFPKCKDYNSETPWGEGDESNIKKVGMLVENLAREFFVP